MMRAMSDADPDQPPTPQTTALAPTGERALGEDRRSEGLRARAEARLQDAFERELLSLSDLEGRLLAVQKARTVAELEATTADLPARAEPASETAMAVPAAASKARWAIAILGGNARKGVWHVPGKLRCFALAGGVELDLREAVLPPIVEIQCVAVMGGIEIVVPRGARVESGGIGILGGFEQGVESAGDGPLIRVSGVSLMGGVEVRTKGG